MVGASCQTKDGDIWFSLGSNGLLKFDGFTWVHFDEEAGFKWKNITEIVEDAEGNLWFGHENKFFLTKYDGEYFYHYENIKGAEEFEHDVLALLPTDEAMWIGMRVAFAEIKNDSIYFYGKKQRVVDNWFNMEIYQDIDGYVWIGSHGGGVGRIDGDSTFIINYDHGMSSNSIFDMEQDAAGNYCLQIMGQV